MPRSRISLFQRFALVVSTTFTANLLAAPAGGVTTFPGAAEFSPQVGVPSPATQIDQGFQFTSVSTGTMSVERLTPLSQATSLANATFKLTDSEDVHLVDPQLSHFAVSVVNGSTIVGSVTGATGSEAIRYVTVNIQSGSGEFRLRVLD
jgi:hypothetical protein